MMSPLAVLCFATTFLALANGLPTTGDCASAAMVPGFTCHDFNNGTIFVNDVLYESTPVYATSEEGAPYGYTNNDSNFCGDATWNERANVDSPTALQCGLISEWCRAHPGRWYITNRLQQIQNWTPLIYSDANYSCAFIATSPGKLSAQGYYVGNTDVADLVEEGLKSRQTLDKLEVQGEMTCSNGASSNDAVAVNYWILNGNKIP